MTRLDEALARLERAVARLEAVGAAAAAGGGEAAGRATAAEAENRRLRTAAGEIAAKVDDALARVGRALGEGG